MSKSLNVLNRVRISSPCSEDWDSMTGNDQVRFCSHCSLHVHNISSMTRRSAEKLVENSSGRLCVRYIRLPNGKIHTEPQKLVQLDHRTSKIAAGVFALASLGFTAGTVSAQTTLTDQVEINVAKNRENKKHEDTNLPYGSLVGKVLDFTGAIIPGAQVELINKKTTQTRQFMTDEYGVYSFPIVEEGVYSLKVEAQGFRKNEINAITIDRNQQIEKNVVLDISEMVMGVVVINDPSDPLVIAVEHNNLKEVKRLISRGANVNVIDENIDKTPLAQAVSNSNLKIVKMLLYAGARVDLRNGEGRTALMYVKDTEMVTELVIVGADVNAVDNEGNTPLIIASGLDNKEVIQKLIESGADINAENKEGVTPIVAAIEDAKVENVEVLIKAGVNINKKNKDGKTALTCAKENEQFDIVELLLSHRAIE
jgi:hypothetical protein